MIKTGNPEIDAIFVELMTQIQALSENAAMKSGKIAVLSARIAELEKSQKAEE